MQANDPASLAPLLPSVLPAVEPYLATAHQGGAGVDTDSGDAVTAASAGGHTDKQVSPGAAMQHGV